MRVLVGGGKKSTDNNPGLKERLELSKDTGVVRLGGFVAVRVVRAFTHNSCQLMICIAFEACLCAVKVVWGVYPKFLSICVLRKLQSV